MAFCECCHRDLNPPSACTAVQCCAGVHQHSVKCAEPVSAKSVVAQIVVVYRDILAWQKSCLCDDCYYHKL